MSGIADALDQSHSADSTPREPENEEATEVLGGGESGEGSFGAMNTEGLENPTTPPPTLGIKYHLIPWGSGFDNWEPLIQEHVIERCSRMKADEVSDIIRRCCEGNEIYQTPEVLGQIVVRVAPSPGPTQDRSNMERWIEWALRELRIQGAGDCPGVIETLVSCSLEYDGIVKMIARESGVNSLLVGKKVKAAPRFKAHKDLLKQLADLRRLAGEAEQLGGDPDDSLVGDERYVLSSDSERPADSPEPPQSGGESPVSPITPDMALQALPEKMENVSKTPHAIKECLTNMGREQTSKAVVTKQPQKVSVTATSSESEVESLKRAKAAGRFGQRRGESFMNEWLPPLRDLPPGTPKWRNQLGQTLFNYIGEVWDIEGHVLVVLIDSEMVAHNATFKSQLFQVAGVEFLEEWRQKKDIHCASSESDEMVLVNGGTSGFYSILHVPCQGYMKKNDLLMYKEYLVKLLEESLDYANELGFVRVVLSVEAIRSGGLHWQVAEDAAVRAGRQHLMEVAEWSVIKEVVVVTAPQQAAEKKATISLKLKQLEDLRNWQLRTGPKVEPETTTHKLRVARPLSTSSPETSCPQATVPRSTGRALGPRETGPSEPFVNVSPTATTGNTGARPGKPLQRMVLTERTGHGKCGRRGNDGLCLCSRGRQNNFSIRGRHPSSWGGESS